MTMVPNLQPNLHWDITKDFEPISLVATVEWGLITNEKIRLQNRRRSDQGREGIAGHNQLRIGRSR